MRLKIQRLTGIKKAIVIAFGLFASCLIILQCLSLASQKDFWNDEVYELIDPLNRPVGEIWSKGVYGSPSATPLYFSLQRVVIPKIFKTEKAQGHGYDWRVALRLVPAITQGLSAFLAFLIFVNYNALVAVGLPLFLGTYNFALYYGAETRIYATWLGLCLVFYAATLRLMLSEKTWRWGSVWCFLCLLLTLTSISSPVVIGFAVLVIAFFEVFSPNRRPRMLAVLVLGIFLASIVFLKYRMPGTAFSLSLVQKSLHWNFISTEGLRMLEGPKKTFELIIMLMILIIAGTTGRSLTHRRLFLMAGVLGFSQLLSVVSIFILQYASGYWYAPRHAIFAVAMQAVTSSCFVLLCLEVITNITQRWFSNNRRLTPVILTGVIVVAFMNWFNWRVTSIPDALERLKASQKPYCHGPIQLTENILMTETAEEIPVKRFNQTNLERHELHCVVATGELSKNLYDFSPQWIYGP